MPVQLTLNEQTTTAPSGPSLFELAQGMEVHIPNSCDKNGKCRECLIEVVEGMEYLSPRAEAESHLDGPFRLSCCTTVVAKQGNVRCHTMRRNPMVIADGGHSLDHILAETPLDPAVTRQGHTVLLEGEPIAESDGPLLGIATDIGTTTLVMRLVDLETGQILESQSFENPQRFGGSDVMARILYDSDHKGRLLQRTLLGYLTHAIESFDCHADDIYEMLVVGNSTMRDLLFGLNVESIGKRPYRSLTEASWRNGETNTTALSRTAKKMRLPLNPAARITSLPLVAGHIGADTTACMLAIDLMRQEQNIALMDIGTNTELIVGNKDRIWVASCPAGPAMEGGAISCGMPGLEGAIESFQIEDDQTIRYQVIGDVPPQGICGSGLIGLLSELVRTGQLSKMGRFVDTANNTSDVQDASRFTKREGVKALVIDAEHSIFLTEKDISHIALAKGANVAGLKIVMEHFGKSFEQLDCFYLAGGFGKHLDLCAAKRVGLLPDLPNENIVQIGNAAIEGATIGLKSMTRRHEVEALVGTVTHVELETDPQFFDHYIEGCQFVSINISPVNSGKSKAG